MNYLAHAYLSFEHPDLLVGNMISDFVKGRKRFDYSQEIQQGIILHRQIDAFTDVHEATKEARTFLKPAVGLYSGAFVDIVYDHFLANDAAEFTDLSLQQKARDTYAVLHAFHELLPPDFQRILPFMQSQNWLYNYRSIAGTERSFGGLVRRASFLESSKPAFMLFEKHYQALKECYNAFFPFVKAFSKSQIEELKK
jgi:acyl carrier protein phosphodiesterase